MNRAELLAAIRDRRLKPKLLAARFSSPCDLCAEIIEPLDALAWSSSPRMSAHVRCFREALSACLDDRAARAGRLLAQLAGGTR